MTVTQSKPQNLPDDTQIIPYHCNSCACDLTYTIRIKCADPACEGDDDVDLCPTCFCAGKEFGKHKRGHAYRVIGVDSTPIFTEDWGADEELLLLTGLATHGMGNWKKISEHVGTRTQEEVEKHYNFVYIDSPNWPLPQMNKTFHVDSDQFQERKRRRIAVMSVIEPPVQKIAPISAPGNHEIAGYFPGRLEFEHEVDNEAEDLVKDLEFGVCLQYGGDQIIEDESDPDVRARIKWEESRLAGNFTSVTGKTIHAGKGPLLNGAGRGLYANGDLINGDRELKSDDTMMANGSADDDIVEESTGPIPIETRDSLMFKMTLLEMYANRVEKRRESKAIMFDRGLLDYKKMQANDKKRQREDREFLHRLRPFARLQTAADYEVFAADMLYEAILRKRIQELQQYRRLGLSTPADIEKYEIDLIKRTQSKAAPVRDFASDRLQHRATGRQSSGPDARRDEDRNSRELTPKLSSAGPTGPLVRKPPAPLNLANSPSLHLLTPPEQYLCSQLRILPKPYLVIKETLVREYARRGGKLRRREARDLVKIDVNKTSRVWDFLVQAGFLKINNEPAAVLPAPVDGVNRGPTPALNGSPQKDLQSRSPRPPIPLAMSTSSSQNSSLYSSALLSTPFPFQQA